MGERFLQRCGPADHRDPRPRVLAGIPVGETHWSQRKVSGKQIRSFFARGQGSLLTSRSTTASEPCRRPAIDRNARLLQNLGQRSGHRYSSFAFGEYRTFGFLPMTLPTLCWNAWRSWWHQQASLVRPRMAAIPPSEGRESGPGDALLKMPRTIHLTGNRLSVTPAAGESDAFGSEAISSRQTRVQLGSADPSKAMRWMPQDGKALRKPPPSTNGSPSRLQSDHHVAGFGSGDGVFRFGPELPL